MTGTTIEDFMLRHFKDFLSEVLISVEGVVKV